jgi:hypothetical protein
MMRLTMTLAALLALAAAEGLAADRPLREFTMPPARMDGDPVPKAAPRARIEAALPGASGAEDQQFALACTAAEAALTEVAGPGGGSRNARPRCAGEPFTVLAEQP